jgi:hypothetical protein
MLKWGWPLMCLVADIGRLTNITGEEKIIHLK